MDPLLERYLPAPTAMFQKPLFLSALYMLSLAGSAQYTQEVGGGVSQSVVSLHVDPLNDRILLAGSFAYGNNVQVSPGILSYSNGQFEALGCGVAWDCVSFINQAGLGPNSSQTVTTWQGDVYLGGDWSFTRDGVFYDHIMRWDGEAWHPLGAGCDGKVKSIRVINNQLIVAGWFTHADTVLANGLARWDGEQWHRIVDVPVFFPGSSNQIEDVNYFQDTWYIGGQLPGEGDLLRWTVNGWETIGSGFHSTYSQVNSLEIHDERLYVAGSFARCPPLGNGLDPGNGVVAWDGENWDDLGGGTCGSPNGTVVDISWWNDELYATGFFDLIGGQSGGRLARWNGQEWCMLLPEGYWSGGPNDVVLYHDTLFIGGSFSAAGDEPSSCFVQWTGGDHTEGCGALVGIAENETPNDLVVFPSPAADLIRLSGPDWMNAACVVRITDVSGRIVLEHNLGSDAAIQIHGLASGSYTIQVLHTALSLHAVTRFIKR